MAPGVSPPPLDLGPDVLQAQSLGFGHPAPEVDHRHQAEEAEQEERAGVGDGAERWKLSFKKRRAPDTTPVS